MNQDDKSSGDSGSFTPEARSRTDNKPAEDGTSTEPVAQRKQTVIQPLPNSQDEKDALIKSADSSAGAEMTPTNTTTIPNAPVPPEANQTGPQVVPSDTPPIPAGETSKLTSYLPTKDHLGAVEDQNREQAAAASKSSRPAVIVLCVLLVVAVLLGVGWLFLSM